ncbi:Transcriptional regulatory protein degu [Alloalcanivorax dieselolei B5]|uniref:Transcriptional regulatory protein degu n=1 Tax=Alcanivorax dieselolei (strain DSM 16502 / CGMCC 1.3690 / MCCC 1A00001 / B-5) TaxID=930169 RepID=K0CBY5_ALCDB|nr:response regulator transcription factor [Alloalcanivorax dieselolei]AFT69167.1 Transcriptional regulatory protein degu [Alloalcanivorax dieselolei B5]GGJ83017.1 DNA-binding response regulator [Alloalcanivorax dieselolei]
MTRILIADDHPLFRAALRQAVASSFADARIIEADSLAALERLGQDEAVFDLILLDLHMPGTHGFSGLVYLRDIYQRVPLAVISANEEVAVIQRALHFGADGFIPKSASVDAMTEALERIMNGERWVPEKARGPRPPDLADYTAMRERITSLTPQQFRVMGMLLEGMQNKVIAYELDVSEATVKAHMTAIFRKLGVRNRTQAVLALKDLAIDPPGDL